MPTTKVQGAARSKEFQKQLKKDIRAVRWGLEEGSIKTWDDLFTIMKVTRVGLMIGIAFNPFVMRVAYPERFTIADMMAMAKAFGCSYDAVHSFLRKQIKKK